MTSTGHRGRPRPLLRTLLGDVLRRARRQQGRTLADVARAATVSVPYLSELERGRKEASSEVLAAVCDALRLDLSDVLAEAWRDLTARCSLADRRALADRRSLAGGGDRRAPVVRLDTVRTRRAAPPGPGDVTCLAA